jgi:Ca-activated chloride channel homolog
MPRPAENRSNYEVRRRIVAVFVTLVTILAGLAFAKQSDDVLPQVGEGSLLYRSPISGYQSVPLLHTDVALDVRGPIASATVTQQYANSSSEPIEAVYIFPLPHDGAVYDMEIKIGNRVIRSVVRERQEAKRIYEAAKSEGKRAGLVEEERPNIFTTSVANIMPGDKIEVRLRYVQTLLWEQGRMRLVFPMVVGPRYIPGTQAVGHSGVGWSHDTDAVRDASRITPPVRDPDSRPGHDISVNVDLEPGFQPASIKCISHDVNVQRLPDGREHIELASGSTIPNRDFVLEVRESENAEPRTALFLSPDKDSGETQFLVAAFPPPAPPRERMPVEMLYMIDVSGSMSGTSIEQARSALLEALDRLRPVDRFGILAFSSGYGEFAAEPLPATAENVAAARRYVQHLDAGGGTEMLPALLHLMRKPKTPGCMRHIILLTDGDLGNEEEIFAALRSDLGDARLYTIAIGSAPNLFLATKMAQFGRGTFTHIADITEIREQMARFFESIENPVLTDIKLSFEGVEVTNVYPERLPDLFSRQPLLIYGRISRGHIGKVHLKAHAADEPYEATLAFDTSEVRFHPGITTLWARQSVEDFMDHWRHADEKGQAEIRASVIAHAIRYHLVTRFTSLVAVEEVVANPNGRSDKVAVPTELPEGWQMDKVFGAPATGNADAFLESLGAVLLVAGIVLLFLTRRLQMGALA